MPLHDTTPFEAEVAVGGSDRPAISIRRQVYRGDGLTVVIVENMPGNTQVCAMEGSFARTIRDGRGLATFTWNRPTDRFAWDQPGRDFAATLERPTGTTLVRTTLKMFPDAEIAVGACRLPVKHGVLAEAGRATEFRFSPDLRTNLRRIATAGPADAPRSMTTEVKSLTVEGVPPPP